MHEQGEIYQQMNADIVEYLQGLAVIRASGGCQAQNGSQKPADFQKQTDSQEQTDSPKQTHSQKQAGSQEPERSLIQRFQQLEDAQTRAHRQGANANMLIASIIELGLLVVVLAGVGWVVSGTLDLAVIGAVMVMITRFSEPMATFVSYTAVLELIDAALIRIEALLAIEPLPQPEPEEMPASFEIAFEQVSFRYQGTQADAVTDLSFTLPEHGMTALVGPSGAGKTTVTRLLMRYADPQQGADSDRRG
ncbi:ABC transporter ATP-binding protein [Vibrio sp. PP-XX7]